MALAQHLTALEASGLIRLAHNEVDVEYLFRHGLIQNAAYESLLKADRRVLHRVVGEILERAYPEQQDELSGVLARHFAEAGETEKALGYLLKAGARALAGFATSEAITFLRQAEAMAREQNWVGPLRRALAGQGQAHYWRGENEPTLACYQAAVALCDDDQTRGDLFNKIGDTYHEHIGNFEQGLVYYQKALETLKDAPDSVEMARVCLNLGYFYAVFPGNDKVKGIPYLREAQRLLDYHHQYQDLAFCHSFLSFAHLHTAPEAALEFGQQALGLSQQHRLSAPLETAYIALGDIWCAKGNWPEATRCYEGALRANQITGYVMGAGHINLNLATAYLATRRLSEAIMAASHALAAWEQLGQRAFISQARVLLSVAHELGGQLDAAEAERNQALAATPDKPGRTYYHLGYAYTYAGRYEDALHYFRLAAPHLNESQRRSTLSDPNLGPVRDHPEFRRLMETPST